MANFGFSIGDILLVSNIAWTVYKTSKHAEEDFRSISDDVRSLQASLRELNDEAENPNSLVRHSNSTQQKELSALMRACRHNLEDFEELLANFKSLETSHPRHRDRLRFTAKKQADIRMKISSHSDRINRFLNGLHTGALGRIEDTTERHTLSFGNIKAKLDAIHQDIVTRKRDPSILTNMEGWIELEQELVDDNITETDIDLNRDVIKEWLKYIQDKGTLDEALETIVKVEEHPASSPAPEQCPPSESRYQATVEDYFDGDEERSPKAGIEDNTEDVRAEQDDKETNAAEATPLTSATTKTDHASDQASLGSTNHTNSGFLLPHGKSWLTYKSCYACTAKEVSENIVLAPCDHQICEDCLVHRLSSFGKARLCPCGRWFLRAEPWSSETPWRVHHGSDSSGGYMSASDSDATSSDGVSTSSAAVAIRRRQPISDEHRAEDGLNPNFKRSFVPSGRVGCRMQAVHEQSNGAAEREAKAIFRSSMQLPTQEHHSNKPRFASQDWLIRALIGKHSFPSTEYEEGEAYKETQPRSTWFGNVSPRPLTLTLEEMFSGIQKSFHFDRKVIKPFQKIYVTEAATVQVRVQPGARAGDVITFPGVGDQKKGGAEDLRVVLEEIPHSVFKREGNNLSCRLMIDLCEALGGWTRTIRLPSQQDHTIALPGPTASDWTSVYKGKGMPAWQGFSILEAPIHQAHGDLIVCVTIASPSEWLEGDRTAFEQVLVKRAIRCRNRSVSHSAWPQPAPSVAHEKKNVPKGDIKLRSSRKQISAKNARRLTRMIQ